MMRVLELVVALIIVAVLAVVAGLVMPGSGHVERSMTLGKDLHQVYDVLNNFRRFPEYAYLNTEDPKVKYDLGGKPYGVGAQISWTGNDKIGSGKLTIDSDKPEFDKIDAGTRTANIVWKLENDWRGHDKHFTLDMERQGRTNKLTALTWNYDVSYGWNLIDRYSRLYIHGAPDAFIQYSLTGLQNVLSSVRNIDYDDLVPYIVQSQPTPMLFVSTQMDRSGGPDALNDATSAAVKEIQDAAKKLGVNIVGPRTLIATNYGDQTFTFDIGMAIDSSSVTLNGKPYQLAAPKPAALNSPADASSTAAPADSSSAPADAASADVPAASGSSASAPKMAVGPAPGSTDKNGNLVINKDVRGALEFGGAMLRSEWNGTYGGVPLRRDQLQAYALTHGYKFDVVLQRAYDVLVKPEETNTDNSIKSYAKYEVYLPLSEAPEQTPEQAAGIKPPEIEQPGEPAASGTAATPAESGTAAAPAESATAGE